MQINDIKIEVLEFDVPSLNINDERRVMGGRITAGALRLLTDVGIEGNAHIGDRGGGGEAMIGAVWNTFSERVIGMNIADREKLWHQLPAINPQESSIHALWSYIDVAMWDAAGKAAGMPIHEMLGAARRKIEVYATYPPLNSTVNGYVAEAAEVAARGFRAYKIHPAAQCRPRMSSAWSQQCAEKSATK